MSNLAFMLYWGGQLDEAEQWWRQAAQMGISSAQTNLTILLQQRGRLQG
ncbi:tetratricopeptide repeat protein [Streptomyces thermospinosisporus]